MHFPPCTYKELADLAQALGIFAAALYFAIKLLLGYLFVNLTVKPVLSRVEDPNDDTSDILTVTLELSKGDRAAMALKEITVDVKPTKGDLEPLKQEFKVGPKKRNLRLTPGETYLFSSYFPVPRGQACQVMASVHGGSGLIEWPNGYWQSTAVSLPLANKALNSDAQKRRAS